jgi:hypothetical protein
MKKIDLTGKVFGRWTVVGLDHTDKQNKYWLCKCECGKERVVRAGDLPRTSNSSNKLRKCKCTPDYKHPATNVWYYMKKRCYSKNPNHINNNYEGRGIKMCIAWAKSSRAFVKWAVSTGYKEGLTIERKDVNKGYSPENCCWIPLKDQAYNRRNTKWVIWKGEKISLAQLIAQHNLPYGTILKRILYGWPVEKAINTAVKSYNYSMQ